MDDWDRGRHSRASGSRGRAQLTSAPARARREVIMMASFLFTRQHNTSNEEATTFTCGSKLDSGEWKEKRKKRKEKGKLGGFEWARNRDRTAVIAVTTAIPYVYRVWQRFGLPHATARRGAELHARLSVEWRFFSGKLGSYSVELTKYRHVLR